VDVFQDAGEYVTIGSSIPCMESDKVSAIEPNAPAPELRLKGLKEFNKHGVQTFVSMSPTYPTQDKIALRSQLEKIAECDPEVIFHEPINPRGGNFEMTVEAAREAGDDELADELESLKTRDRWVEYATNHLRWVQEIGRELDLPVHLWPDKQLIKHVDDETAVWLQHWRDRQSPESFADRDLPTETPPGLPTNVT
jgi:DNA repair photolyase